MQREMDELKVMSHLYQRQVIQLNKIDQVHKLMQRMSSEQRDLFQPLLEQVRELFLADLVSFIHIDHRREKATVRAHVGYFKNEYPDVEMMYELIRLKIPNFYTQSYVTWNRLDDFDTLTTRSYSVEHALFLPIRSSQGRGYGALSLYRCYSTCFDQEDIALLVDISIRLGDYLYGEEIQRTERERLEVLEQVNQRILEINQKVHRLNELPGFLKTSVECLLDCDVFLYDDQEIEREEVCQIRTMPYPIQDHRNLDATGYTASLKMAMGKTLIFMLQGQFELFKIEMLKTFWHYVVIYKDGLAMSERLEWMATHDQLTSIWNRHGFFQALNRSVEMNGDAPLSIAIFDIDNFKEINDSFGHAVGDKVLQEISRRVIASFDPLIEVYFARYGGEEFVLATRNNVEGFIQWCERIRLEIAGTPVQASQQAIPVTVSVGITSQFQHIESNLISRMLQEADEAMYHAKRSGKNRTMCM